jgi:uncharacterized protein DUF4175
MAKGELNNYEILISKLDQFTRKYYVNKLIRGTLYVTALVTLLFITYNILEYNYYFGKGVRKFFFFSFLGVTAAALIYWIGLPLMSLLKLGKRIPHDQAAKIIGEHFGDVKDKLLNVLQLKRQSENARSSELVFASINQKTESIKVVPFKRAIDFRENRKYLRYTLPPLLLLLALLVAAPSIITDSTARIFHNSKEYERDAPFQFYLEEEDALSVEQYKDFVLHVEVDGSALPNEVFIDVADYQYRLSKESNSEFIYRFKNVNQEMEFRLFSGPVSSKTYTLDVLKKPNLLSFEVKLDYPGYTKRRDETLTNIGDLVVPAGTRIVWDFNTLNTDAIDLRMGNDEIEKLERKGNDLFTATKPVHKDGSYTLYLSNEQIEGADSVRYNINVIPDLYPKISVEQIIDSIDRNLVFFVGIAGDDYGVRKLTFNYQIIDENQEALPLETFPLSVKKATQFQYDYTFNIDDLTLKPGQQLNYFFEVFDNDAVNGSKSTKTNLLTYRKPTAEEFEKQEEENNDDIKQTLKNSLKESKKLQEDMRKMREKLLQEKDLEWQDKKELENLMKRQENLQNQLENARDLYQENLQNQEEYKQPTEEQIEKQKKMEEFFEELMDEEMMEMMEKLQEMMEEMQKDDALQMLENFEFDEEELQKELDRLMELFKQMELEQLIEEQIEKLQELAQQEEELSEKTKNKEESNEELQKEQEEIQEEFDEVQEEMEKIQEKNEELEKPKNLDDTGEEMDKIDQDMQNSQEQLKKDQNEKASDSQKNAAERMKQMAQQMQAQMNSGQMQQMQEDMATLRQLLENLITLSFDQEDNIESLIRTNVATPHYIGLVQDQFKIQDDFKVVEDSLQALSKRVMQIESFVSEKVTEVKENLKKSLVQLEARKKTVAAEHQQRVMKNMNDLALMLSEVMNQMQQQMSTMMPGSQMCDKPGKSQGQKPGSVPMDKISEGQKKLNEEMKEMGKKQGKGEKGSSEQFAKMAARQAALRKALRENAKEKQQKGQGEEGLEEAIQQMDKIETELVNKQLTNEMLRRQEEILTRLLEAEQAEREREMDNKRKAEVAQQIERKFPPSLEEYIKKREAEIESFQTVSPALRPYYKFLVEEYYDALKKQ